MSGAARTICFDPRNDVEPLSGRRTISWTIVHNVDVADPVAANADAKAALASGATGLALRFASLRRSDAPQGGASDLEAALAGVDPLQVALRLEGGAGAAERARSLADLIGRRGIAPERATAAFGLCPLSGPAERWDIADAAAALIRRGFAGEVATLDMRPLDPEGMGGAGALAAILAGALWWLDALEAKGIARGEALPRMGAALAVTQHHVATIARLRALRLLWGRLLEVLDATGAPLAIHAETAPSLANGDGHHGLVRSAVAALAAVLGEADSLAICPALELPPADAARAAINIHHLLRDEAGIGTWCDAAAGSGSIEAETDRLAEGAWATLGSIQAAGGLEACLEAGAPLVSAFWTATAS